MKKIVVTLAAFAILSGDLSAQAYLEPKAASLDLEASSSSYFPQPGPRGPRGPRGRRGPPGSVSTSSAYGSAAAGTVVPALGFIPFTPAATIEIGPAITQSTTDSTIFNLNAPGTYLVNATVTSTRDIEEPIIPITLVLDGNVVATGILAAVGPNDATITALVSVSTATAASPAELQVGLPGGATLNAGTAITITRVNGTPAA